MADLSIDDLTPALLTTAAALYVAVFNAAPWNDSWTEAYARVRLGEITDTPGYVGVALHQDDGLCGFAMGHSEQWFSGRHFLLQEMCVRPDRQRRGLGSALITALEARLSGTESLYLLTAAKSGGSILRTLRIHGGTAAGRDDQTVVGRRRPHVRSEQRPRYSSRGSVSRMSATLRPTSTW